MYHEAGEGEEAEGEGDSLLSQLGLYDEGDK